MSFRQKLAQFMYGRNGMDAFGRFLLILAVVLMLLSTLFSRVPLLSALLLALEWAALLLCIFRVFSRNTVSRQQENAWYYQRRQKALLWLRSLKDRWQQRKDYKFFRCPSCHALLRVPKGKGILQLTCRKCGNRFNRRT